MFSKRKSVSLGKAKSRSSSLSAPARSSISLDNLTVPPADQVEQKFSEIKVYYRFGGLRDRRRSLIASSAQPKLELLLCAFLLDLGPRFNSLRNLILLK